MKATVHTRAVLPLTLTCGLIAGTGLSQQNDPPRGTPVVCEDITATEPSLPQALTVKRQNNSFGNLERPGVMATAVSRSGNMSSVARSEILHDGHHWTLVPKGAVLFVPERKSENVGSRPVGTLLSWQDFLAKNPAWISTHETTFDQASGDAPFSEAKVESWKTQERVIVAVHQGGPISVAR